jgi:hypothetical protein
VSLTGVGALLVVAVLALAAPVATGWGWERARGWWRWPARSAALLTCVLLAFAVAGVAVNRKLQMYPTWGDLVGSGTVAAPDEPRPAPRPSASAGPSPSRIEAVTVTGGHSGISLPVYVYLPPGYDGGTQKLPVIEALAGFPGTPQTWFDVADPRTYVDREITAGRMPPTIVVFPVQHASPTKDSECVDAAGGARFDSYLSGDVRDFVVGRYRARAERAAWGIVGFSTGGFCAANLGLRHPDRYAAAASLSGYFTAITDGTTGDLYKGDAGLRNDNSPLWRLGNRPVPAMSLYLACAADDGRGLAQLRSMAAAGRPPLRITTAVVPSGGHTGAAWQAMTPAALDWLAAQLAGPSLFPAGTQESGESLDGDVTG